MKRNRNMKYVYYFLYTKNIILPFKLPYISISFSHLCFLFILGFDQNATEYSPVSGWEPRFSPNPTRLHASGWVWVGFGLGFDSFGRIRIYLIFQNNDQNIFSGEKIIYNKIFIMDISEKRTPPFSENFQFLTVI